MTNIRLRPQVAAFAQAMERRLRANDHRGTWHNDTPEGLLLRIDDEANRLAAEVDSGPDRIGSDILSRAADVANYSMFVADVCGNLGAPPVVDTTAEVSPSVADGAALLVDVCHGAAKRGGWWNDVHTGEPLKRNVGELLMLIVSEVAEAMEGHRKGLQDDKLPHRPMIEVEMADAVIRIADLCGGLGLDLGGAIVEKMAYNAQRADHKPEARKAAGGKAY